MSNKLENSDTSHGHRARHYRTFWGCVFLFLLMVSLSYAFVPLYYAFCRLTGFDGTPIVATEMPPSSLINERKVRILFDTNISQNLGVQFTSDHNAVNLPIGQTGLVYFNIKNTTDKPIAIMASYNISPEILGGYFNKLICFCFEKQVLAAGQEQNYPVSFFIDPEFLKYDPEERYKQVILSYTIFPWTEK